MAKNPDKQLPRKFWMHNEFVEVSKESIIDIDIKVSFDYKTCLLRTDQGNYGMFMIDISIVDGCKLCNEAEGKAFIIGGNGYMYMAIQCPGCKKTALDAFSVEQRDIIAKELKGGEDILRLMTLAFDFQTTDKLH